MGPTHPPNSPSRSHATWRVSAFRRAPPPPALPRPNSWAQALEAGKAPKIYLQRTHEKTLNFATLSKLREYALDGAEADEVMTKLAKMREKLERSLES